MPTTRPRRSSCVSAPWRPNARGGGRRPRNCSGRRSRPETLSPRTTWASACSAAATAPGRRCGSGVPAEQGVPASAFEIGYIEEREGDLSEAERWYRQAAEGGDQDGTLNLAVVLEKRGDTAAAMEFYRRAWELGSDMAAFNLGRIYDNDGKGDLAMAAEWYERAAEWGNSSAAYNLGHVRLDQGDTAGQVAAWQRAADLKHPQAAYNIGLLFKNQGDEESAITWLRRSVEEFGDPAAADLLAELHERRGE